MQLGWLLDCGKGKHYKWTFCWLLCMCMQCGILSTIPIVGLCPVGFWPVGFCLWDFGLWDFGLWDFVPDSSVHGAKCFIFHCDLDLDLTFTGDFQHLSGIHCLRHFVKFPRSGKWSDIYLPCMAQGSVQNKQNSTVHKIYISRLF
jgi:hypothetical protein